MMTNIVDEIDYRLELFYSGRYDELFLGYENDFQSFRSVFLIISKDLLNQDERIKLAALALQSNLSTDYKIFVFNYLPDDEKICLLKKLIDDGKNVDISLEFLDIDCNHKKFIKEHVALFAKLGFDVMYLSKMFDYDKDVMKQLDNYLCSAEKLTEYTLNYLFINNSLMRFSDILYYIVLDIVKNENAVFSDIKWIDGGQYSSVLIIKDKVLKIGYNRSTERFPNNPYIIKPLLRKSLEMDGNKLFLEVTERVITFDENEEKYNTKFGEELYQLYKKIRDLGLVWTDVGTRNVGRLIKDNVIHWKGNLCPSDEALELEPYVGDGILLKAGDLVLLDADFIWDEKRIEEPLLEKYNSDDFIIPVWDSSDVDYQFYDNDPDYNYEAFEERYQKELSLKK